MSAIRADNLTKRYRKGPLAVEGISFEVEPGEVFGLLGPNGAGKSTLIGMLTGQLTPTSGRAEIAGLDISRFPEQLRGKIGLVFEHQNIYPRLTARENLALFASLLHVSTALIDPLLDRFGLLERADDQLKTYSRGMKQRILLARAILHDPAIIILDEPTSGLDPRITQELHEVILNWRTEGKAILLATHSMEEAAQLCQRVMIIDHGRVMASDTPHRLMVAHGRRHLQVEYLIEGGTRSVELPFEDAADLIESILREQRLVSMHTVEASLQEVFVNVVGRGGRL